MESITSFLSPQSTERRKAATIDAAFSSLTAAGADGAVDEFYPKIVAAIKNGNLDEFDALGGRLLDIASKNMAVTADARTEKNKVARSINQLIPLADEKNITIPSALLNDAAKAFVSKDQGALAELANSIGSLVDAGMKVQKDEAKPFVKFEDGSSGYLGTQTLSRYNNRGEVIPFGNTNADRFSKFAQVSLVPVEINANPQAYAANQVPNPTSIQSKEKSFEEARSLYESGDRAAALNKLRALKAADVLGDITDQSLDDYFRVTPSNTSASSTAETIKRKPIEEIIK